MAPKKKKARKKKDTALVKSEPITFKVTPAMRKEINKQARLENRSVSSFIINAVSHYLEKK